MKTRSIVKIASFLKPALTESQEKARGLKARQLARLWEEGRDVFQKGEANVRFFGRQMRDGPSR